MRSRSPVDTATMASEMSPLAGTGTMRFQRKLNVLVIKRKHTRKTKTTFGLPLVLVEIGELLISAKVLVFEATLAAVELILCIRAVDSLVTKLPPANHCSTGTCIAGLIGSGASSFPNVEIIQS